MSFIGHMHSLLLGICLRLGELSLRVRDMFKLNLSERCNINMAFSRGIDLCKLEKNECHPLVRTHVGAIFFPFLTSLWNSNLSVTHGPGPILVQV